MINQFGFLHDEYRMMLPRLRQMRQRQKDLPGGHFLVKARLLLDRRQTWSRARMHWTRSDFAHAAAIAKLAERQRQFTPPVEVEATLPITLVDTQGIAQCVA